MYLICSKVSEMLLFDAIFEFMIENKLLSSTQSSFNPNYSCVDQLLSITQSIFSASDANLPLEVCDVFLDLSKAFVKVWHEGLLYKLKESGINSKLIDLIESLLHNKRQRVALNGQSSKICKSWCSTRFCIRDLIFSFISMIYRKD